MKPVDLDPVRGHVEILRFCKRKKAELKALEDNARAAVERAMGENETGELDGKPAITWVRYKKRQLNQAMLREVSPELIEEHTSLVEQRAFKVVDDE